MNAFVRLLYALLVAGAVTAFAGFAIFSFYQPPKAPEYPESTNDSYNSPEYDRQQAQYQRDEKQHEKDEKQFYHNIAVGLLPIAIVTAFAGLGLMRYGSEVIGEGLTLGGVAIDIFSIIMTAAADARILRFWSVTLLLILALLAAHFRFSPTKKRKPLPVGRLFQYH